MVSANTILRAYTIHWNLEHYYTEPKKKRRKFNKFHKIRKTKYLFLFFKLQVFIATQGVGTHHKKVKQQ